MFYQNQKIENLEDGIMQEEKNIKRKSPKIKKIIIILSIFIVLTAITIISIFAIKNILIDKFMHD